MASTLDDEDLALSINPSHTRRNSTRSPDEQPSQPAYVDPPSLRDEHLPNIPSAAMPERLNQYTILRTLGEGSFGKVKLATHKVTGQKVALKIINRKKLMARDMQGRMEREIQYLQLLRHPHIIKLFTVITTPGEIVMVLEYAGAELFNYIVEHGKFQEDKARAFFQQIVCAVEYCHRHKIVHRDLKPENLLLDENLNVKVADFGLSNIMTDGNFLKTSCGSPNYAAPEVISGKLYAGPEVDVWSCGVILYVLLVGRLPFDDEYIPALFKKIAQGNYHMPSSLSPGASRLIRKMLHVSPVHRITIQEIRQDPWFNKNLPEYLRLPVAEFLDTGVDHAKAIDPRSLAPTKSAAVVEKMHNEVVGKLGKAMGYGREDVQQALAIDEPNAIKDAYLIVRENQMMKDAPSLANNPAMQPFLAQSPPAMSASSPRAGRGDGSPHPLSLSPAHLGHGTMMPDRSRQGSGTSNEGRPYISTIGILPDSLPELHAARMSGAPEPSEGYEEREQNKDEQASTAARLKPHNRVLPGQERSTRPEAMTPLETAQKKSSKGTKWQFGIRSRNAPSEAMLAIFKALKKLGAEWEVEETREPGQFREDEQGSPEEESGISSSEEEEEEEEQSGTKSRRRRSSSGGKRRSVGSTSRGRRRRAQYGSWNDWGFTVPADPWVINARFLKKGLYPPGVLHSYSANSSRVDLNADHAAAIAAGEESAANRRRSSTMSSTTSLGGTTQAPAQDNGAFAGPAMSSLSLGSLVPQHQPGRALTPSYPEADDCVYVYLTIQLYSIEKEFYLVDFKAAGYERLIRRLVRQVEPEDEDDEHHSSAEEPSETDEDDDELSHRHRTDDIAAGKPREAGHWDALRKMSSHGSRRAGRGGPRDDAEEDEEDEADSDGGFKSGIKLKEEYFGDGRVVDEKDVSSPFPFLDVASRLIIQLAEAD